MNSDGSGAAYANDDMEQLTVGSYFTGIGGLDLGLERAGMRVISQCENDLYCSAVLEENWPGVPNSGDIRKVTRPHYADVFCGGFPCQPVSQAGKRLRQKDPRWLWPEFIRVIRLARPRYVLVENVPGLLAGGMGDVLRDLATSGFDAEWDCIPAAAVGAPHLRYRVFLVAYAQCQQGGERRDADREWGRSSEAEQAGLGGGNVANTGRLDSKRRGVPGVVASSSGTGKGEAPEWQRFWDAAGDSRPVVADANGGHGHRRRIFDEVGWQRIKSRLADARIAGGTQWSAEPDVGRVAHGVPSRVDRLTGLGNAVVPQVAEAVGRLIVRDATVTYHTAAIEAATRS